MGLWLEEAPFGLLLVQEPDKCVYANSYARQVLGLASSACSLPQAPWLRSLDADRAAIGQEGDYRSRYRTVPLSPNSLNGSHHSSQSHRFVRWYVTSLGDRDAVFLLDVTIQQRLEEAARALINDLSHELRTPLATILTHLEVLNAPNISEEISRQSASLLKTETLRMVRLVHEMLELGRLETSADLERRPVDLLAVVEGAVSQVAPQAEKLNIALTLEADTPLPLVLGDGDRLHQTFLTLLDNAVKYCRSGDSVVVSLECEREGIRCVVRDSGPGIPAKHLPFVTRRFYRGDSHGVEGNGLGLAIVNEILHRHQTGLHIESQTDGEETGTRIWFLLPASHMDGERVGALEEGEQWLAG